MCVCTHTHMYHLGNLYGRCQEALRHSCGWDCAELQFGSRRGIFMLSRGLTVSISHSFVLILFLRKSFNVCLYNLHC